MGLIWFALTDEKLKREKEEEGWRLYFDLLKHLSTLCTGFVLILIAFVETFFP